MNVKRVSELMGILRNAYHLAKNSFFLLGSTKLFSFQICSYTDWVQRDGLVLGAALDPPVVIFKPDNIVFSEV